MLLKIENLFHKFSNVLGKITTFTIILMILNVFYDVVMRYFFKHGSIAMQEMEWHLFSIIILVGISFTLNEDVNGHVRVDIIYDKLSYKRKAMINMVGSLLFILPLALVIGFDSIGNAREAFDMMEQSGDPGGLPYRWIVKTLIPVSFFILAISSLGYFVKNLNVYRGDEKLPAHLLTNEIEEIKASLQTQTKTQEKNS